MKQIVRVAILTLTALVPGAVCSQTESPQPKPTAKTPEKTNEELILAGRRSYAISQVISLSDEARRYTDKGLRAHVLARAASTLWDADRETARGLFQRAWEAALRSKRSTAVRALNDRVAEGA